MRWRVAGDKQKGENPILSDQVVTQRTNQTSDDEDKAKTFVNN